VEICLFGRNPGRAGPNLAAAQFATPVRRCSRDGLHPLRARLDASDSTTGVGGQLSFRLIQDNQFVAKRVTYSRATADRYVEWGHNRLSPGLQKVRESLVDVGDHYVRFRSDMEVYDQLGIRLRKTETRSLIGAPQQTMTQPVSIKGDRRVKIGDAKQMVVEFSK
jgi:hypothetical protein